MRIFWNDFDRGIDAKDAEEVDLSAAQLIWSEEVRGAEGNFLGLIDDQNRTIQFIFAGDIPDHIEDARHLEIVDIDFPDPDKNGSYSVRISNGDVEACIAKAFKVGADYRHFGQLEFKKW
jgi:hypothetical protein